MHRVAYHLPVCAYHLCGAYQAGARKNFSELAQRVEEETVSLPAEQAPDAYAELKTQNPDFMAG